MTGLGNLELLLIKGYITEEEYKVKKNNYIELLLEMYIADIITKEELYERVNK